MKIWAWGANSNGQCGLGYSSEQVSRPVEVPIAFPSPTNPQVQCKLSDYPDAIPIKIEGGSSDTVILVDNIPFPGPFEWQPNFHILPYPKVRDVACGWDFSAYISNTGTLYTRGNNTYDQLGRDLLPDEVDDPIHRPKFTSQWGCNKNKHGIVAEFEDRSIGLNLTQLAAGLRHGIVTSYNLDMLIWGNNSHNEIGPSTIRQPASGNVIPMKRVPYPNFAAVQDFPSGFETGFTHIACGKEFTLACDTEGFLYGCGVNKFGVMCHAPQDVKGFQGFASIFERIPNRYFLGNIAEIKCGWTHVVCLLDTGKVVTWGRNDMGQLGRDSVNPLFDVEPNTVSFPERIVSIACGCEHNLALGHSGAVYSWGWNEHDNCGVPSSPSPGGAVKGKECVRYPVQVSIPCEGRIQGIGCGTGTSYAVSSTSSD